MITHQARKTGLTISAVKEIAGQLEQDKTVLIAGLNSPDLYLRMIANEGVQAEAEKQENGFIFKNVVNLKK